MRLDIQCLRGVAISFVVLYHLFPTLFVNGFLGVDMWVSHRPIYSHFEFRFFVISGFLMSNTLSATKIETVCDILKFYFRRFRRILPLYYLVIFVSMLLVHLYLGDFWWGTNRRYGLASLFLVTNQLIIHDSADYFREVHSNQECTRSPFVFSFSPTALPWMHSSICGPSPSKCNFIFSSRSFSSLFSSSKTISWNW